MLLKTTNVEAEQQGAKHTTLRHNHHVTKAHYVFLQVTKVAHFLLEEVLFVIKEKISPAFTCRRGCGGCGGGVLLVGVVE